MKASRIIVSCTLFIAVVAMTVLVVKSVIVPIRFESECEKREEAIKEHLIDLRTAMLEYHRVYGKFTDDLDSLEIFLKTTPHKEVSKEGSLSDEQLEKMKLNEAKAAKIIESAKDRARKNTKLDLDFSNDSILYDYIWNNDKEVIDNKLQGFRRDTIESNMLEVLYKGKYDENSIEKLKFIPYSNDMKFEVSVKNDYKTKGDLTVPIFEIRAPYTSYLSDLNQQELVNLIDRKAKEEIKRIDPDNEQKLKVEDVFTGLKVGSIEEPNNFAGNWE